MKGFINLFVNFPDFDPDRIDAIVQIIKRDNQEVFALAAKTDYPIMLIPCQDEASRIEKVDFNAPFPRFISRNAIDVSKADVLSGASVAEALVDKDFNKSHESHYLGMKDNEIETIAMDVARDKKIKDITEEINEA